MFKVKFVKTIFDAEEPSPDVRFAVLSRDDQVPFAPTVGQGFSWPLNRAYKVVAVTWNFADCTFNCKVEDEFPNELSIDGLDFEELIEHAQIQGWQVVKVFEAR